MPVLHNQRHELFAQHLASGKTATEAIALAGYKPNGRNADALKKRQEIARRVAELQSRNLDIQDQTTAISDERLAAQFAKAYAIAEEAKRPEAMVAATIAQAKFSGRWVERSETTQVNEFAGMNLAEMRQELVKRAQRLGLDHELRGLLEGPKDQDDDSPVNGNSGL
jgi:hypothetical protein